MKKLTYAIALCTLLLAGCSQDEGIVENKGELVTLNYNVSLGDGVQSRSAESLKVNKLLCAVYEIDENGTAEENAKYTTTRPIVDGNASFAPTLSDELDYKIVFWAYYESEDNETYYDLADLSQITVNDNYAVASNADKDAFTSTDIIRKGNSEKNGNVTLVRPFGKVSVLTSEQDYNNAIGLKGTPTGCKLTITGYNDKYDALTGTWSQSQEGISITLTSGIFGNTKTIDGQKYRYLADEYLFAGGESTTTCLVVVNGEDADGQTIELYNKSIPNVPVGANASTNLYNKNLLTGGGITYNITIETGFSDSETNQGIEGTETGSENQEGNENQENQ